MQLVHAALSPSVSMAAVVAITADRRQLAKRLWRATAADGTEFGFELSSPLAHGDTVYLTGVTRYVIQQELEPVLAISLPNDPAAAAIIGWAVGNLHFPIEAQPQRLLAPDDVALRQSLERIGIGYQLITAVFCPHRLAAGAAPHSHTASREEHPFVFRPRSV